MQRGPSGIPLQRCGIQVDVEDDDVLVSVVDVHTPHNPGQVARNSSPTKIWSQRASSRQLSASRTPLHTIRGCEIVVELAVEVDVVFGHVPHSPGQFVRWSPPTKMWEQRAGFLQSSASRTPLHSAKGTLLVVVLNVVAVTTDLVVVELDVEHTPHSAGQVPL